MEEAKRVILAAALLAGGLRAAADVEYSRSHPEIHRATLDGFTYTGKARIKTAEEVQQEKHEDEAAETEVVMLDNFVVTADPISSPIKIDSKLPLQSWDHRTKLGTGLHVKKFQSSELAVVTILYVPVFLSFSW